MSRGKGHIPIRTCIACGRKDGKPSMIRIVLNAQGVAVLDVKGSKSGRGAYVCDRKSCMESLKQGKHLSRAFRKKGPLSLTSNLSDY